MSEPTETDLEIRLMQAMRRIADRAIDERIMEPLWRAGFGSQGVDTSSSVSEAKPDSSVAGRAYQVRRIERVLWDESISEQQLMAYADAGELALAKSA